MKRLHSSVPHTQSGRFLQHAPFVFLVLTAGITLLLTGCGGGQEVGGTQGSLGGDISPGFGSSLGTKRSSTNQASALSRGAYPMIETSFQLGSIPGDPFDYEKVNVQVVIKKADGNNTSVAAFFDGGTTWRMRYTPTSPGQYNLVEVKLNGATVHEGKLEKKDWTVSGTPKPGFVRVDRGNHTQFALDSGEKFYPLGHNVAWESDPMSSYESLFGKMHAAGENWSRVWLDQRDGKHLDAATQDGKARAGQIDLEQAKRWDGIVSAAEKNDIYFQLVIENSNAFSSANGFPDSSNIRAAWDKNPLNVSNGGTLKSPGTFFVDPAARALEQRKLYYILSRWGYSPNIMGFELFHDVQNTDAAFGKHWDDIAMWHREMAIFAKANDANHHLLTTSSAPGIPLDSPVWETVDFVQAQVYASDLMTALAVVHSQTTPGKKLDKPYLVSEFGTSGGTDPEGTELHVGLWSGLFAGSSGGAQYWDWENAEKQNLYDSFKSVTAFVTAASLAEHPGLVSTPLTVESSTRGALSFGPGASLRGESGAPTEFVVGSGGPPSGIERLSPVLAGKSGGQKPLIFQVSYSQAGTFAVTLGSVAMAGGHLKIAVDGKAELREFAASKEDHVVPADQQTLKVSIPSGSHTVTVANDGADWITIRRFTLSNYAPALGGIAKSTKDYAIAWIYNRDGVEATDAAAKSIAPATGQIKLAGLQKGKYRATWWDTRAGKTLDSSDIDVSNAKDDIALTTPSISRDVALYIMRAGTEKAKIAKGKVNRGSRNGVSPVSQDGQAAPQPGGNSPGQSGAPPLPGRTL